MKPIEQPPVEKRMAERRERILEAAREIIADKGYEALTMRDLARASRVTVPTVYNLVGSKDRVLLAAVEEQTERFVAGIELGDGATPAVRLLSVVDACTRELLRLPRYYRSLLRLLFASDAADEVRAEVGRALGRELGRALSEMGEAGQLASWVEATPVLDRLAAHLAFTSLQWASGELTNDALRATARYEVSLALAGITTGPVRAEFEAAASDAQSRVGVRAGSDRRSRGRRRA